MIINYDIENDELINVLNDSPIQGLSFASELNGKIVLFVVDGYECYVDLN